MALPPSAHWPLRLCLPLFCFLMALEGGGQTAAQRLIPGATNLVAARSASQQFIIHGKPLANPRLAPFKLPGQSLIRLDPALLTVSCERIKTALLRELDAPDQWRGKIHVTIQNLSDTNRPIDIRSEWFANGWQYHVFAPETVAPERLVRALVHVLLLEIANRDGQPRLTELPLWVTEGFTGLLLAKGGVDLVLQAETRFARQGSRVDHLRAARDYLGTHPALSFNQLGLPTAGMLAGERWKNFQVCAFWLVVELTNLPNGRMAMGAMLRQLPSHLNWQFAFFNAYGNFFGSPLEVEKWWSIGLVNAKGRDQWQGWSREDSWVKLNSIKHLPSQVRENNNTLPIRSEVKLQQVIEWWDFASQREILGGVLQKLQALRLNAAPEILPLVDAYERVLKNYLQRRAQAGYESSERGQLPVNAQMVVRESIKQLDTLDVQLEASRRQPAPMGAPASSLSTVP